jgi:hypothetical protein
MKSTSMNPFHAEVELVTLSKEFLASQKSCCGSKCLNCPYSPKWVRGSTETVTIYNDLKD